MGGAPAAYAGQLPPGHLPVNLRPFSTTVRAQNSLVNRLIAPRTRRPQCAQRLEMMAVFVGRSDVRIFGFRFQDVDRNRDKKGHRGCSPVRACSQRRARMTDILECTSRRAMPRRKVDVASQEKMQWRFCANCECDWDFAGR